MSAESATRRSIVFVNAYSVCRNYGGPEEGGWWWDSGEPIPGASIPLWDDEPQEAVEAAKDKLRAMFGWKNRNNRYSAIGGEDFVIDIEDHPARAWPGETPHYE